MRFCYLKMSVPENYYELAWKDILWQRIESSKLKVEEQTKTKN